MLLRLAALLSLGPMTGVMPAASVAMTNDGAVAIALREAGCGRASDCVVRGGRKEGKWVFVVWFVTGRNADGSPQFTPGGWIGLTLDAQGTVLDRTPGV